MTPITPADALQRIRASLAEAQGAYDEDRSPHDILPALIGDIEHSIEAAEAAPVSPDPLQAVRILADLAEWEQNMGTFNAMPWREARHFLGRWRDAHGTTPAPTPDTLAPAEDPDDEEPDACTNPGGHEWSYTGTAYGGGDDRWHGEGRCVCVHCGADGDG